MERKTDRIINASIPRTCDIGAGGSGCHTARLVQIRRARKIIDRCAGSESAREDLRHCIKGIFPIVCIDSDQWEDAELKAAFANEPDELLSKPEGYSRISSPAGQTILAQIESAPYRHLKRWRIPVETLAEKSGNCEAEGARIYGAANILANIKPIAEWLKRAIDALKAAAASNAWLELASSRVPLDDSLYLINFYAGTAGGQGSGAIVIVLGLLALQLEEIRHNSIVRVHLMAPGFHTAQSETEKFDQEMKTQAVIRDLAFLKYNRSTLHIPYPDSDLVLEPRHTVQLFDEVYMHRPVQVQTETYKCFINRVCETALGMELGPFAADLRRARSNAFARARRDSMKKFNLKQEAINE